MSLDAFDPEILQDFLTESGELLEELEGDLVTLESTPDDLELINQIFRALHTIKGSASFLGLKNLVDVAHAAETALNSARGGKVSIDRAAMDLLLEAVDTVRLHMQQIQAGEPLAEPNPEVVEGLIRLGNGESLSDASAGESVAASAEGSVATTSTVATIAGRDVSDLTLPENKTDLIEFLLTDLDETLDQIDGQIAALRDEASRGTAADSLVELGETLARSAEFFEFEQMAELAQLINTAGETLPSLEEANRSNVLPRVEAIASLLREQAEGLANNQVINCPVNTLTERVRTLLEGGELTDDVALGDGVEIADVLRLDGVSASDVPAAEADPVTPDAPGSAPEPADTASPAPTDTAAPAPAPKTDAPANAAAPVEQTIRVEVGRLETLMNLVGELVLQKNRFQALSRQIEGFEQLETDFREDVNVAAGNLD
ncbi:MAG: Hpt domain-containing protein, partial [Planctomycetota bacterium]